MKKLFNNPYVIAVLAVCAVLFASRSVLMNLGSDDMGMDEDEEEWDELFDASAEQQLIGIDELSAVNSSDIFWQSVPQRDPFSVFKEFRITAKELSQDLAKPADSTHRPRLSALVVGERSNFAVLNGRIVQSGDFLDGFWVQRISERGVDLLRDGERLMIEPEG